MLLLKTKNLGASSLSLPSVKICVFHFAVFIFATLFRCIAEVKMAASAPVMRYAAARIAFLSLKFLTCFLCNELQHMSFTILSAFNNVAWNSGVLSLDPLLCISLWCLASNWVVERHFLRCQFTLDSNPSQTLRDLVRVAWTSFICLKLKNCQRKKPPCSSNGVLVGNPLVSGVSKM